MEKTHIFVERDPMACFVPSVAVTLADSRANSVRDASATLGPQSSVDHVPSA